MDQPGLTYQQRAAGVVLAFACFSFGFLGAFYLCQKYIKKFSTLSLQMKADNCSRIMSTIHSVLIVPLYVRGLLTMTWDSATMEPLGDPTGLQSVLCITIGYFAYDFCGVVLFKLPLWGVFAVHHVLAVMPYVIYMFVASCPVGLFILSCFMLVEFTNIPLNLQTWLEQNGKGSSVWYAVAFYSTFVSWIFVRVINPIAMVVILHTKIVPNISPSQRGCLIPGFICAYAITLFCVGVFCFILCKEVYLRWKTSPNPKEVVDLNQHVRSISFNNSSVQMTEEEQDITLEDPDRMLLFEAREKIHQLEGTIVDLKEQAKQQVGRSLRMTRGTPVSTSEV